MVDNTEITQETLTGDFQQQLKAQLVEWLVEDFDSHGLKLQDKMSEEQAWFLQPRSSKNSKLLEIFESYCDRQTNTVQVETFIQKFSNILIQYQEQLTNYKEKTAYFCDENVAAISYLTNIQEQNLAEYEIYQQLEAIFQEQQKQLGSETQFVDYSVEMTVNVKNTESIPIEDSHLLALSIDESQVV